MTAGATSSGRADSGRADSGRADSVAARLARLGFADAGRAERLLADPALAGLLDPLEDVADDGLVTALAATADPDQALLGTVRLLEGLPGTPSAPGGVAALRATLRSGSTTRDRLLAVLGSSAALGDHLARHPAHWTALADAAPPTPEQLRARLLGAVGADPDDALPVAAHGGGPGRDALRVGYRRHLLALAGRDLAHPAPKQLLSEVAAELADLAAAALEAALAVARAEVVAGAAGPNGGAGAAEACRLAVVALGKCGGRELNYVSDVDVVFVAEAMPGGDEGAALRTATDLATRLMRICADHTGEGTLWPVDAGLRPEGGRGPLVRSLASHLAYYDRWAKTWEFQALLKARPVAGDEQLGRAYVDAVAPLVWAAADRDGFVDDVRAMRRRVEQHIRPADAHRELKLGPGGLRDVEFAVQLLQLVHGRGDVFLRSPTTLAALEQLSTRGYVGRADAGELDRDYRFLRALEHRIQLQRLRRTHVVPTAPAELRRLGRSLGMRADPGAELEETWRRHSREVRRLHEKLFYRPLLAAVARLPGDHARLTPDAARARLEALGYADPAGALRHLEALTTGLSRRAAIQRTLLPVLLGWFADAPDPDAGLLGFRQVSEALGETPWYLRLLRDEGAAAERMARVLASSRWATELLLRAPEAVAMLGDDAELSPRTRADLEPEVHAAVGRHSEPDRAAAGARAVRRRELFRIAVADVCGLLDIAEVGEGLSTVAQATLAGGFEAAVRDVEARVGALPTRLAVLAMGRLGGHEMGYASDADVLFVHDPLPGAEEEAAGEAALAVANAMRQLLSMPSPEPALPVDADLRPEGRSGPLVRTLASYAAYYERWGLVWERQALLRCEPVAGDTDMGERFIALVDPLRWPAEGLATADVREVRRLKARVEAERLPRGADPGTHTKLGPGGLADVEWTAQLLQLRHAGRMPGLRTTRTLAALDAAVDADLLSTGDRDTLAAAWRLATRARNASVLLRGRPTDQLPHDVRELGKVAQLLGYGAEHTTAFVEDYRRTTRRARRVVEQVLYGR